MKTFTKAAVAVLALCLFLGMAVAASAATFTDAHGNVIELDDSLEAYTEHTLYGADDAARRGETNLGDLWADALRWFAVSGAVSEYFEEDDVTAGNTRIDADADHTVALWNGGNLKADVAAGKFGAEQLAEVLPYPNKAAVVYMTGAQLLETLEAASQGLPYTDDTAAACASLMQVSGLKYTVDTAKAYDRGEAYGDKGIWFRANSLGRVAVGDVNGQPFDAGQRGHVDDASAAMSKHLLEQTARQIEETVQSGVQHLLPILVLHENHHRVLPDAGIVDQHGNVIVGVIVPPLLDSLLCLCLGGDVEGEQLGFAAFSFDEVFDLHGGLLA